MESLKEPELAPEAVPKQEVSAEKIEELKKMITEKRKAGGFDAYGRISDFTKRMEKEYPNENGNEALTAIRQTKLFNILSGSTTPDTSYPFDLPDGEVEKFIREEL